MLSVQEGYKIFSIIKVADFVVGVLIAVHFVYAAYKENFRVLRVYVVLSAIVFARFLLMFLQLDPIRKIASLFIQQKFLLESVVSAMAFTSLVFNIIFVGWVMIKIRNGLAKIPWLAKRKTLFFWTVFFIGVLLALFELYVIVFHIFWILFY